MALSTCAWGMSIISSASWISAMRTRMVIAIRAPGPHRPSSKSRSRSLRRNRALVSFKASLTLAREYPQSACFATVRSVGLESDVFGASGRIGSRHRDRKKPRPAEPPSSASSSPSRRRWLAPFVLAATLGILLLWQWPSVRDFGAGEKTPLNVVLVTADTLRADKLGCYGNPRIQTPHIDRLAEQGVLFENATTVVPLTLPAHSSILTGTFPMYHGVRDNGGYYLDAEQMTLAETLQAKGYATGAFGAACVLDSRWGLDQGFDRYFDDFDLADYEKVSLDSVQRGGDEVLAEAEAWMESGREGRFFFLLHLDDALRPYEPSAP